MQVNRSSLDTGTHISFGKGSHKTKEKCKVIRELPDNCAYCGDLLGDDRTLDHLDLASKDGKLKPNNVLVTHKDCNGRVRNNIPLKAFLQQNPKFVHNIEKQLSQIKNRNISRQIDKGGKSTTVYVEGRQYADDVAYTIQKMTGRRLNYFS